MKNKYRLRLTNMQYFNDLTPPEPEGGEPNVTPPVDPVTPPIVPPVVEPPAPVTFTQEQLDAAKTEQQSALLKQLGVENVDQLTQTLTDWKAHQETLKTDQEKQQEALTNYQNQIKEQGDSLFNLQAENAAIKAKIKEDSINDVITLAKTKVTEEIDITKAIEMVAEQHPYFKDVAEQPPIDPGKAKPTFSQGQHQQTTITESEKWAAAFGVKKQ
ncbi:hypothetical protein JFU54_28555 [Bacillus sp. TH19]|uniref:hypothetical protein n=1 Tax=Bacillus sp. TH19 TaxID=2796385 RepID=UPI00191348BC|nr:hypothetical protein [Bacillus sp. TH19]MBK5474338.1 hypothetical protein [Bacillus sp. TH19]